MFLSLYYGVIMKSDRLYTFLYVLKHGLGLLCWPSSTTLTVSTALS